MNWLITIIFVVLCFVVFTACADEYTGVSDVSGPTGTDISDERDSLFVMETYVGGELVTCVVYRDSLGVAMSCRWPDQNGLNV